MKVAVIVHTDGGCSPNPGDGGWGAVLRYGEHVKELYGGEPETTNNRMEIMAAIQALEHLKRPSTVQLHTDSTYVRQGVLSWMAKWKRNGWQTSDKKPVKNVDLWQRLEQAAARHAVEWFWVKGHAGVPDNERADELATLGRLKALPNAIRVASWSQKSRGETHEGAGRGVGPASRALGCPDGVGSGQIPAAARRRT